MVLQVSWNDRSGEPRSLVVDYDCLFIGRLSDDLYQKLLRKSSYGEDELSWGVFTYTCDGSRVEYLGVVAPSVSRNHLKLVKVGSAYELIDHGSEGKGSTYGTFIDGIELGRGSKYRISPGEWVSVRLGKYVWINIGVDAHLSPPNIAFMKEKDYSKRKDTVRLDYKIVEEIKGEEYILAYIKPSEDYVESPGNLLPFVSKVYEYLSDFLEELDQVKTFGGYPSRFLERFTLLIEHLQILQNELNKLPRDVKEPLIKTINDLNKIYGLLKINLDAISITEANGQSLRQRADEVEGQLRKLKGVIKSVCDYLEYIKHSSGRA